MQPQRNPNGTLPTHTAGECQSPLYYVLPNGLWLCPHCAKATAPISAESHPHAQPQRLDCGHTLGAESYPNAKTLLTPTMNRAIKAKQSRGDSNDNS